MSKRGLNNYRRKDGRYEGRYADGYGENGKMKYRSIYGKTYTEVKEKLLQIKARIITPKVESGLTVKELFAEWLSAKLTQTKASTYANYAFKAEKHELDLYNKNEQNRLKSALLANMDLTKLGIMIALYTGVRIGELCGLKWSDIDLNAKTISIERTVQRIRVNGKVSRTELIISTPKSHTSVRTIPIPEFLVRMLKAFKPSSAEAFIITGNAKLPDPRTMQYRFKALLIKIELRTLNFHSLRHLFATNCVELCFDVKTLSKILGHSSVEITMKFYYHVIEEQKKPAMTKLNEIY